MAPIKTVVRSIFEANLRRSFYLVAVILKLENSLSGPYSRNIFGGSRARPGFPADSAHSEPR
jgi:hypothetical protein